MEEMIDYVTACETFLEKMEACTTQSELDKLCQVECILFAKSKVLYREVYFKRNRIIEEHGSNLG